MKTSSKVQMRGPAAKFSVLRPYPKILALNRSFRKGTPNQNYLYVVDQDFGLRKYSAKVDSFQQSLKEAQWRYDCFAPIVRCLYVELLSPDYFREGEMDIYYSHIEVNLSDFKQLILQQAVYLIMESIKGYQALLNRYRKVSVNDETIGVGSNGQVLVWINRFLQKSTCQEKYMITPYEIITQIIKLVKERSEPVCSKLLKKIEEYNHRIRPSFKQILDYLKPFSAKNNIRIPQNLKYLLHQHRIKQSFNQLQSMKVSMKGINQNERSVSSVFNINVKSPRCDNFNPSQVVERPVSRDGGFLDIKRNMKTMRKYSAGEGSSIGLRQTIEAPMIPVTPNSPGTVSQSAKRKISTKRKWSCWQNDNQFLGIQPKNRLPSFCEEKSLSGGSKAKTDNQGQNLPSFLKPFNKQNMKHSSGNTENTKAGNTPIKRSNLSQMSEFQVDVQTVKKINRKSSIQLEELTFRDKFSGCEVQTLSKFAQHPLPDEKYNFEPTFNCIPESINEDTIREAVIKENDWTKTFKTLLEHKDGQLNISLCDGKEEVNNYLSDVKLDKLDSLSRQMVQSVLSQPSQHSIVSNGSLEC